MILKWMLMFSHGREICDQVERHKLFHLRAQFACESPIAPPENVLIDPLSFAKTGYDFIVTSYDDELKYDKYDDWFQYVDNYLVDARELYGFEQYMFDVQCQFWRMDSNKNIIVELTLNGEV